MPRKTEILTGLESFSRKDTGGLIPGARFICSVARKEMGLTQEEMAAFLGVSKKAVQSYEQRWRQTPVNVERLCLMYLGSLRLARKGGGVDCWDERGCPEKNRRRCIVWQCKRGDLCWMFTGTYCSGKQEKTWSDKLEVCRKCVVMRHIFEEEEETEKVDKGRNKKNIEKE